VPVDDAAKLDFTLTDKRLKAYDPGQFFTSTKMIKVVPQLELAATERSCNGIPAKQLVGLAKYPLGQMRHIASYWF